MLYIRRVALCTRSLSSLCSACGGGATGRAISRMSLMRGLTSDDGILSRRWESEDAWRSKFRPWHHYNSCGPLVALLPLSTRNSSRSSIPLPSVAATSTSPLPSIFFLPCYRTYTREHIDHHQSTGAACNDTVIKECV
jgi:hypothetical protein